MARISPEDLPAKGEQVTELWEQLPMSDPPSPAEDIVFKNQFPLEQTAPTQDGEEQQSADK